MWKYVTCVVSILFMGGHVYPSVFAQSSEDNYILPVILVYPAVWAEKNTVPPTIEINVLGQFQEDDVLDGAEGDEKKALDTESSTKYFEIPKSDVKFSHLIILIFYHQFHSATSFGHILPREWELLKVY